MNNKLYLPNACSSLSPLIGLGASLSQSEIGGKKLKFSKIRREKNESKRKPWTYYDNATPEITVQSHQIPGEAAAVS